MNLEKIEFNNYDENIKDIDVDLILKALHTSDNFLINKLNSNIVTNYQAKINLIQYLLNNKLLKNTFKTINDVKLFFAIIVPLSNEYKLGSLKYNYKIENEYFFVHNSISKEYVTQIFDKFIYTIIKHFDNLEFYYYDLKNKRFNKTLDIIFVFKINGNKLVTKNNNDTIITKK